MVPNSTPSKKRPFRLPFVSIRQATTAVDSAKIAAAQVAPDGSRICTGGPRKAEASAQLLDGRTDHPQQNETSLVTVG